MRRTDVIYQAREQSWRRMLRPRRGTINSRIARIAALRDKHHILVNQLLQLIATKGQNWFLRRPHFSRQHL